MSGGTRKGNGKGCFGSPTRATQRTSRERIAAMRHRAFKYARSYIKRRRGDNTLYDRRMKDDEKYQRELNRIARKAMKRERAKDSTKNTTVARRT